MTNVPKNIEEIKKNTIWNIMKASKWETYTENLENLKRIKKKKEKIEPRYVALIRKRGTSAWENWEKIEKKKRLEYGRITARWETRESDNVG